MDQNNEASDSLSVRLARIAGQVRGVRRMIDEGRPCLEITGQISAAVGALKQVRLKLLATHLHSCLPVGGKPWQPEMLQARVAQVVLELAKNEDDRETQNESAGPLRKMRAVENDGTTRKRIRKT